MSNPVTWKTSRREAIRRKSKIKGMVILIEMKIMMKKILVMMKMIKGKLLKMATTLK
jgi:hypothetical protein